MAERAQFDTAAKRTKLPANRNPYWTSLSGPKGGLSLGYRKSKLGKAGTWVAKAVIANNRFEQAFATADDRGADESALSYSKAASWALDWARQKACTVEDEKAAAAPSLTVGSVCASYIAARKRDERPVKSGLRKHLPADSKLAQTKLTKLAISDIHTWRDGILKGVGSPHTANRCLSDVRAALNRAHEEHHKKLPSDFKNIVQLGCKNVKAPANPRPLILPDETITLLVDTSFVVDEDLGTLSMVEGTTGARFSQINRLKVRDLQMSGPRLLMPVSFKGRGEKPVKHIRTPIDQDVANHLFSLAFGRDPAEPLLMHWQMKQLPDGSWTRDKRVPWKANTYARQWDEVLEKAELAEVKPKIVMYAFRHSSIVRALRAGIPIRMVAALHDTSVSQIEKHYSAHITEITDDLARLAIIPLAPKKGGSAKTSGPSEISAKRKSPGRATKKAA